MKMRSLNIKTLIYLLFTLISLCDTFKLFYVEKCINKKIINDEDIWHSIYIKSQNKQ